MSSNRYEAFPSILVERPHDGVLRLMLNRPERLNALDADGHRELADIWRVIDQDNSTRAVLLCASGKSFSAGGDFDVVLRLTESFEERAKMWREARGLQYHQLLETDRFGDSGFSGRRGAGCGAGFRYSDRCKDCKACRRSCAIGSGRRRPRGNHMAAALWNGEGEISSFAQ